MIISFQSFKHPFFGLWHIGALQLGWDSVAVDFHHYFQYRIELSLFMGVMLYRIERGKET